MTRAGASPLAARVVAAVSMDAMPEPEFSEAPNTATSVGLHESFGHDEIIMFGLPLASMHRILNVCGALVREGTRLTHGATSREVLEGYEVRFRSVVARESYDTFLGYGCRFYGERSFGVLQCVWPDKEHRFPGDEGAATFLTHAQPMLP